jgi:kelch-like protein 10
MSIDEVCQIIKCDELNVKSEEDSVDFALKWIEVDIVSRLAYVARLLQCLRLNCVSKSYLLNKIKFKYYLYHTSESKELLRKRLDMNVSVNDEFRFLLYSDLWTRPRVPHEMLFVIGGWSSGMPTNSIETYDCRANVWMQLKDVDKGRLNLYIIIIILGPNNGFD